MLKLHVVVASCAGHRRAPREILLDEWPHHGILEFPLKIDHVERNPKVLGHPPGIMYIVERTATVLRRSFTLKLRQTALVPQLHCQTDGPLSSLAQNRRDG